MENKENIKTFKVEREMRVEPHFEGNETRIFVHLPEKREEWKRGQCQKRPEAVTTQVESGGRWISGN